MPEPPPTCRRLEKPKVERPLDNATQRAIQVGTKGVVPWVSDVAFPFRSVPSSVFVAPWLAQGHKISPGFHAITTSKDSIIKARLDMTGDRSYMYSWY